MIVGLDRFREHFAAFADCYVLIGGAAAWLALDTAGLQARVTKDLDIVLCVEALDAEFGQAFWTFVEAGGYEHRQHGSGRKIFYRFTRPRDESFPVMLELFSRQPDGLVLGDDSVLTPIPVAEEVASLSAILLDGEYYAFLHSHKYELDGLSLASEACLIPFKARAWLDLTARRANGESIDSRNIKKHRGDVLRLFQLLTPDVPVQLPRPIRDDMVRFLDAMEQEIDGQYLNSLGLKGMSVMEVVEALRRIYAPGGQL